MWLAAGFVLLVLELVTPSGFFIMFFGVGAHPRPACSPASAWSRRPCGAVVRSSPRASVADLLLFRGKIQAPRRGDRARGRRSTRWSARSPFPVDVIAPGAVGRVALRGSNWEARNEGDIALGANQRCRVTRVSGLQLGVVAE